LGHVVSADGIRPDPKKVKSVQDWPVPENVHDVRSFVGLVNYFWKFIKDFAAAAPLSDLTRAKHPWEWTERCEQSFLALKHCLTNAPLLVCPDVDKPYEVVTDAFAVGIGAVLLPNNRPIAFELRKLSDAKKNYHTTEQEMLAVVHALKTWQCYLEGATFTVVTDHVSNTFLILSIHCQDVKPCGQSSYSGSALFNGRTGEDELILLILLAGIQSTLWPGCTLGPGARVLMTLLRLWLLLSQASLLRSRRL
jgi:hypothetical protein